MPQDSPEVKAAEGAPELPLAQVEQAIAKQAPELLKGLPTEKRAALARVVTEVAYQGPLPPPGIAEGWERIVPGAAKKFFDEFLDMGKHQRTMETKLVHHSILTARTGQICAFVLGLVGLGGGIALCAYGNNVGGLGIAGGSLVALVGAFLKGMHQEQGAKDEPEKPAAKKPVPSNAKSQSSKNRRR